MKKCLLMASMIGLSTSFAPETSYLTVRDLRSQGYPNPNTKRGKFKRSSRNKKK
jgi:hypothetical protein